MLDEIESSTVEIYEKSGRKKMNLEFQIGEKNYKTNLRNLSDDKLHSQVKWLRRQEKNILTPMLYHLLEVETRKLYSSFKCSSIIKYAMQECDYTEDEAWFRVSAMSLLKELPEIEPKITSGALSLTNLNQARSLFNAEKKLKNAFSKEKKLEILKSLESKSKSEAKRLVLSLSSNPEALKPEKIRRVSENLTEIRTNVSDKTLAKIEKVKGLLAHSNPGITIAELLDKLLDLGIEKWDLGKKQVRQSKQTSVPERETHKPVALRQEASKQKFAKRIHIANFTQREVWRKAESKCENCGSEHALQTEHIIPIGKGGSNEIENLKLLCRNCNLREAIKHYGQRKIDQHLLIKK